MGNTRSDVTNNVKAQADAADNHCYRLVDVKGGGELVNIMERAKLTKNYSNVDQEIREKVIGLLYNEGKGELQSIEKLVMNRSSNKDKFKLGFSNKSQNQSMKNVCWDIDKRGAVGETALHLCLLNSTALHNDLARRLVKLFPNLVNDIYLSDEFYGESALHLSIVNEDPGLMKFLLFYGADINERCCGKFFLPDDQKDKKQDSPHHEYPILPKESNFNGFSYFGEYPLSFAAIMNQEDCVRILVAKGADVNKQDSNGNTVLHMLVIHDNLKLFSLLLEFGANLEIKNNQGLTPLTLAAKLARKDCFTFIIDRIKTIYLIYGNIVCAAYPLTDIDSISGDGRTDSNSATYLIVNDESDEHLDLLDGFITDLLQEKWRTFARTKFYLNVLFFILFYSVCTVTMYMQRNYFIYLRDETNCTVQLETMTYLDSSCKCAYLEPMDPNRYVRYIFEIIAVIFAITYLLFAAKELYLQKFQLYFQDLSNNPTKILFLFACLLIVIVVPIRLACNSTAEDYVISVTIVFMTSYFLFFFRGFPFLGPLVLMIHKVIKEDLVRFCFIYIIFLMGFSQAMYMAFEYGYVLSGDAFSSPLDSIFTMILMLMGTFNDVYLETEKSAYSTIARLLILAYLIIVSTLLINLLIAMMVSTYESIKAKKEWQRQWAKIVLSIEQSFSLSKRMEYQKRYCHLLTNQQKALVVRRKQTDEEVKEMLSNKDVFRKFISLLPKRNT